MVVVADPQSALREFPLAEEFQAHPRLAVVEEWAFSVWVVFLALQAAA